MAFLANELDRGTGEHLMGLAVLFQGGWEACTTQTVDKGDSREFADWSDEGIELHGNPSIYGLGQVGKCECDLLDKRAVPACTRHGLLDNGGLELASYYCGTGDRKHQDEMAGYLATMAGATLRLL